MRIDRPRKLSVLLEHEDGVMEVFFAILQSEDEISYTPVGSVPRSGSIRATDRARLVDALELLSWAEGHADVFKGCVVAD